ncbi:phosphotransferase [Stackebrandtia soli]|uniref:phosphotransferase n=1 Tax=Stackebrandtia soli TaxID=1892856 RepID=UPI0039E99AB0
MFTTVDDVGVTVVIKGDVDRRRLAHEVRMLREFARRGVPVPAVLDYDRHGSPSVLVQSLAQGRVLSASSADADWKAAARTLRRIHDRIRPRGARFWPQMFDVAREVVDKDVATEFDAEQRAWMRAAIDEVEQATPGSTVTLHGDAAPYHFFVTDDRATVIDVADSAIGDPLWDLTVLTLRRPDVLPDVLDAYGADEALRAHVRRAYRGMVVLRLLAVAGWLIEYGFDSRPVVRELRTLHAEQS